MPGKLGVGFDAPILSVPAYFLLPYNVEFKVSVGFPYVPENTTSPDCRIGAVVPELIPTVPLEITFPPT